MFNLDGINYYTTAEVIKNLSISRQTLWRWRSESKVPLGRKYRNKQVVFTQSEYKSIEEFANRIESLTGPKEQLALFRMERNG
jgi:predicted DNA-binding transcriptional regulator AlpA